MLNFNMGESEAMISYSNKDTGLSKVLPFCITGIGDFACGNHYFTKRFGLDQCLALFTIAGKGMLTYKAEEVIVGSGDIVVINCNNYQYYATTGNAEWHFKWMHFSGLCANSFVDHINNKGIFIAKSDIDIQNQLDCIFDKVKKSSAHDGYDLSLYIHSILTSIQNQQVQFGLVNENKSCDKQIEINAALAFIQDNFKKQINIAEAAKICNLSEYHFIRVFTAYTGYTPYDYILMLRIHEAKKLLLETQLSVSEIAYEIGFSEAKNLITNFKKREGVTPLFYRKNYAFIQIRA